MAIKETLEFKKLTFPEASRTYVFPTGNITVKDVVKICVRPSGTHRLETSTGKKYIIPTGWLGIEVEAAQWSL